jgi:spore coat polysaccharide biosynthesis protein SpsF (cytidylyltransferase family)
LELGGDTVEDYSVITSVIENFEGRIDFTLKEIIQYLDDNPQVAELNSRVHRRWKEFRVN